MDLPQPPSNDSTRTHLEAFTAESLPPTRHTPRGLAGLSRLPWLYPTLLLLVMGLTVARTLRAPNAYAVGHWLHHYGFGFIPRGLIGSLVYPLLQNKRPEEVADILSFFSWALTAGLLYLLARMTLSSLNKIQNESTKLLFRAVFLVFASSSFVLLIGHLSGYLDQILQILGIAALFAIIRDRYHWAGLVSAFAILIHEMYIFAVMPPVFFAAVLFAVAPGFNSIRSADMNPNLALSNTDKKNIVNKLAWFLVPPILAALLVASAGLSPGDVHALSRDMQQRGIDLDIPITTAHLSIGFAAKITEQLPSTWSRIIQRDGLRMIGPALGLLLVAGLSLAYPRRHAAWLRALFVATSLAPLALLLTVWNSDTGRMASLSIYCVWLSIVALISHHHQSRPNPKALSVWAEEYLLPNAPPLRLGLAILLCLGITAFGLFKRFPLMDNEMDGGSTFCIRTTKIPTGYRCDRKLFANSDFELGTLQDWHFEGEAFVHQPLQGPPEHWIRRPLHAGEFWVGSFDRRTLEGKMKIQGDDIQGELYSSEFTIDADQINFLISGGEFYESAYVALEVEGREVRRATGTHREQMHNINWEVGAWKGKSARIRIVDHSSEGWGHINADGFCYREVTAKI